MNHACQTTLAAAVALQGVGIHGGRECRLRVEPAPPDHGVRFVRSDLEGAPEIPARLEHVPGLNLMRQTILCAPGRPDARVETIEHVLAPLHALGLDNARVVMDAPEPPNWDGSAQVVARALHEAGREIQKNAPRRLLRVDRPISFSPPDAPHVEYTAWPSEHLHVSYFLEQDHPQIGAQSASFRVDASIFLREIAPARTFCTEEEVEALRRAGLIKGGDAGSAIVVGNSGILNTTLRFENELARHKMLDLIGDLYLLGAPVQGHIVSHRGGHQANAAFIKHLRKECPEA